MSQLTDEQRKAVESIDKNVLVSAGAGSGKTMVLVERYLEVLRKNPEATVSDIIAVTFTRKAAEEMRSRLKARLREITAEVNENDKPRWSKLLSDADHARIGTIHSLCESILKAFPAEAAVDPQFEILDDLTRARLLNDCVELALQALISEPDADALCLLEYPIESIRNWVESRLEQIPQYRESRQLFGDCTERLEQHALSIINRVRLSAINELFADGILSNCLQYLQANPWPDRENKLEIARSEVLTHLLRLFAIESLLANHKYNREFSQESWLNSRQELQPGAQPKSHHDSNHEALQQAAELVVVISEVASPGNAGGQKGKPLRDILAAARYRTRKFADECPLALNEADEQAFAVIRALMKVVDEAIAAYEKQKLELQRLDYNDLIIKTHALLCTSESTARRHFGEKLRAVLVDEFQDTNFTQAQLLSSICGSNARLFLIGDDKQSIYKFQGADVSTFNEWKKLIGEGSHGLTGDGMLLDLSFSFRSHPSIVDFVNRFFQFYFHFDPAVPQAAHQAQHRALIASRTDSHESARVEIIVYDATDAEQKRQTERSRAIESIAIAAWILEKIAAGAVIYDKQLKQNRQISFGDFAVLVQANGDFSAVESALAKAGIPYVTYAGSGFLDRQEILDIENMLCWLSCPEDNHALLSVLRSPFYGINDGVIHRICTAGQSTLWQSLQQCMKSDEFVSLRSVVASLQHMSGLADQMTLSDLLRDILLTTGYDVVSLSLPNGRQKSRNVWKFVAFARDYNHLSLGDFLSALASMREFGVTKQTDAPLNAENSVKLMTIHKSKGLEFPAVVLPVMGKKVHLLTPKLLIHRDFGLAFDTSRSAGDTTPAFYKAALAINNQLDAEEKKRLLYVAMTRARDFLLVLIESGVRNETSFRLWIKEALALDAGDCEQSPPARKAHLQATEHYTVRYLDDMGVEEWESAGRELAGKYLVREDIEALSKEMGFDLLAPLNAQGNGEVPAKRIHWHRAERVTLPSKQKTLHPTVVGNLFHAVMQHIVTANVMPDPDLISKLAIASGVNAIEPALRNELISRVTRFILIYEKSTLKELVATAARIMPEVNYTVVAEASDSDKRPDLILQDKNGRWHIIDFKTDRLSPRDIAAKLNEHSPQLWQYVRDLEAIAGFRASGWIYFAELGLLEQIQVLSYAVGKQGQLRLPLKS